MKINPFELERYFSKYEFSVKYLLSSSTAMDWLNLKFSRGPIPKLKGVGKF